LTDAPGPSQALPYDYTRLLQLCERAELILRDPARGADRFRAAARVLCEFYRVLEADDAFWDAVERLTEGQPDVRRLFGALEGFEDQEYELLTRVGVDELTAAELAGDLKIGLERYQPGSLPAVAAVRNDVRRIGEAICAAENDLDDRQRRRSRLKLLARALHIAAAISAIGVNIPAAVVPSVVAGLIAAASAAADFFRERENDG
jgi:hypothetical protein